MGFEILTQPQVFLAPITAVGGIQNGLFNDPLPPLYTSFATWTSTASITATTFPLGGIETLTNRSGSYIVTVGGVVQSPTNYTVDPNTRLLTFDFAVNADTPIVVTQIGTTVSLVSVSNLSATNSVLSNVQADRLLVTNLTALSAEFRVVDITQFELSGFSVLGNANIVGNTNVTGTVSASNITSTNSTLTNLTATRILLTDTGTLLGATSATSIGIGSLSARTFALVHEPANDGVDPVLDIGETTVEGLTGFRIRYEEPTNRLIGSSRTGTTILTSFMITTNTGQVGISGLPAPGQALTVAGSVSASGNISAGGGIATTESSTQLATTSFVRTQGGFQNMAVYTTGTATVNLNTLNSGIQKLKVTVIGGGGGGGGTAAAIGAAGGGGGSGGVSIAYVSVGANTQFSYTVGGGGAGGVGANNGSNGTASTFTIGATTITANGGAGGVVGAASATVNGGAGATAAANPANTLTLLGTQGGRGFGTAAAGTANSGDGGSSMFGGRGESVRNTANVSGVAGVANTGAGGSGGAANTAAAQNGGAGGSGLVIVEW